VYYNAIDGGEEEPANRSSIMQIERFAFDNDVGPRGEDDND
jgi:hypothetical protein